MPQYVEKPTLITLRVDIRPESKSSFVDWQAKFNSKIAAYPGFVSLEFLSLLEQRKEWLIVQRFANFQATTSWRKSPQCNVLMDELKNLSVANGIQETTADESSFREGLTEVIVTEVSPEKEQEFRDWSGKIHQVEATFPGFRGVYVQSPIQSKGRHWITLLQFDTMEHLDHWLASSERQELLNESKSLISSLESHRIISPYAGWFASIAKIGDVPAVWKQTMIVLLVLYPIVMLELKYLSPLTTGLDASVGTFIGNALSVTLISFPMMPIAIGCLGWWLSPTSKNRRLATVTGTLVVIALYLLEIAFFWKFL